MMNDRFSASLRQHLLDTANERPAEGQLASIVELVADTAQRPPIVVRLAGFPGRIGPFPSTAVRWGLVAAALLGAAVGIALGGGGGPSRSTVFEGTWTTIDPADDSRMTLAIAAGMTPAVRFEDGYASGAACVADEVKVFTADGAGLVSGSRLAVEFPDGGGCGLLVVEMGPGFYDYDEATDTLAASDGIVWARVPEGQAAPTQPPTAPTIGPAPVAGCLDVPGGEYGFDVVGVVALVTFPGAWHAVDNGFHHLEPGACGADGAMRLDLGLVNAVYPDICRRLGTGVPLGDPTTTTAFSAPGLETTRSPETTIAGYPAARFDVTVPADFDVSSCDQQTLTLWGEGPSLAAGQQVTVILLDVEGVPIGLAATRAIDASQLERDTLAGIVGSLRIVP